MIQALESVDGIYYEQSDNYQEPEGHVFYVKSIEYNGVLNAYTINFHMESSRPFYINIYPNGIKNVYNLL